jgi:signal transduction histidine kinase
MPIILFQDSKPVTPVVAITLVAVVNAAFMWRVMKPRLTSMQTLNAVRGERFRIARDLHDSLKADLSQMAMLCDLALSSLADASEVRRRLDQIYELAQMVSRQVHNVVLELEREQDTLAQILPRIEKFALNYLAAARIDCETQNLRSIPDVSLPARTGKHLLLVIKELLHNITKHAGATKVRFCVSMNGDVLQIFIEDNGCGLSDRLHAGNGTCNVHERMALMQGTLEQTSRPGHGTVSHLQLHLKPLTLI